MQCDDFRDRIDDYVDDELPDSDRRAVEKHLAGCATCRQEVQDVRQLVAAARALPTHRAPERWTNVASALPPRGRPWPWRWAAAALVLMGLTAATTAWWMTSDPEPPGAVAELRAATRDLEEALAARGPLDPDLQRVVDENLAIIDAAIADTVQALEAQPNNTFLRSNLTALHQRRLDVHRIAWEKS